MHGHFRLTNAVIIVAFKLPLIVEGNEMHFHFHTQNTSASFWGFQHNSFRSE